MKKQKVQCLDDYAKVRELTELYRALDYYSEMYDKVESQIKSLAVNMSVSDIKYAIKESSR